MKRNSVFPAIVLALSISEIIQSVLGTFGWLALINSIIGIVGALFFFYKNENYRKLINTWIYLQAIIITKTVAGVNEPVFDLSQFFTLKLGFFLSVGETAYSINFNFLAPVFFIAFKKLQIDELIGRQLSLKLYRDNEILNSALPQTITVLEKIRFNANDNWLLSQLSTPIEHNDKVFDYCLIKSKGDEPILPGQKQQMAHLRLVENAERARVGELNENVFIDWVFVN